MPEPGSPIGRSTTRVDAVAKVTGRTRFTVDLTVPRMLHAAVARSDRAHARLLKIDTARALAEPGCVTVVTGSDLHGLIAPRFGHIIPDHPILAIDEVRYHGEPVAMVLAETPTAARTAAGRIEVVYEDRGAIMDVPAALAEDAPLLHRHRYSKEGEAGQEAVDNIAHSATLAWGDVGAAFDLAGCIVETTCHYPMLYAFAMETYVALADFEGGTLSVVSTTQHPFMVQRELARLWDLPLSSIRVRAPYVGGGYGSKSYTKLEPLASIGARITGRPVKIAFDATESMHTTRSDGASVTVRTAFDHAGIILGRDIRIDLDTGAYADNSPLVLDKAINRSFGPYRVPNLRVEGRAIYTSTVPASSYRGFGAFQGNLAAETNLDRAADRLNIDPVELRRRNLVQRGEELLPGRRPMDADLVEDLELLVAELGPLGSERRADGWISATGLGCSASDAGAIPASTAQVRLLADGSARLLTGSTEMGQGSRTVLTQIVAGELSLPMHRVSTIQSDTATTSFERTTGASRTTTVTGLAVQRACHDLLGKLQRMAAELYEVSHTDIEVLRGQLRLPDGRAPGFAEVLTGWFGSPDGDVVGIGAVRRGGDVSSLPAFWEIGMVGVEIALDPETGVIEIERLVTVGDVGLAINPTLVKGQELGAATQGFGGALFEELYYGGESLRNADLFLYRVPRFDDRPTSVVSILAERQDGIGPYGAKGVGEGALNPIGAAVASAVARATGSWPDRLPLTPPRVWELLHGEDRPS